MWFIWKYYSSNFSWAIIWASKAHKDSYINFFIIRFLIIIFCFFHIINFRRHFIYIHSRVVCHRLYFDFSADFSSNVTTTFLFLQTMFAFDGNCVWNKVYLLCRNDNKKILNEHLPQLSENKTANQKTVASDIFTRQNCSIFDIRASIPLLFLYVFSNHCTIQFHNKCLLLAYIILSTKYST